jgi:hypothetical protein
LRAAALQVYPPAIVLKIKAGLAIVYFTGDTDLWVLTGPAKLDAINYQILEDAV